MHPVLYLVGTEHNNPTMILLGLYGLHDGSDNPARIWSVEL